jgi:hypothetical protein
MLKVSNDARQKYFETGVADRAETIWPDFTGEEEDIDSKEIYDYYYARVGKCWPNFSRNLTVFSYEQLLKSNALDYAKFISTPYLGDRCVFSKAPSTIRCRCSVVTRCNN